MRVRQLFVIRDTHWPVGSNGAEALAVAGGWLRLRAPSATPAACLALHRGLQRPAGSPPVRRVPPSEMEMSSFALCLSFIRLLYTASTNCRVVQGPVVAPKRDAHGFAGSAAWICSSVMFLSM